MQHTPWAMDGGSGRFSCVGADVLIGPRAATRGRPYEIPYPFRGASLWGNSKSRGGRRPPQTMTQRSGHGLERRSKEMQRRISVRVFGAEWTLRRRGPEAPFWSFQGERVLRERGKFEIPLSLSGSLVTFCPHRKSLARRRNIIPNFEILPLVLLPHQMGNLG